MKNILLTLGLAITVSVLGQGSVPAPKLTGTKPAYGAYAGYPYAVYEPPQGSLTSRRQLRLFLRSGISVVNCRANNRPKNSLGQPIWHFDRRIQIEGHEDFFKVIAYNLQRYKNEVPDYYNNMIMKHVKVIRYGPVTDPNKKVHQGSYAWGNRGHIVIGSREWYQDKWDLTSLVLLHEIQHCNMDSKYNSEPGSNWASYHLGTKMKLSPYYCNWFEFLAKRVGFNQTKWNDQYNWKR